MESSTSIEMKAKTIEGEPNKLRPRRRRNVSPLPKLTCFKPPVASDRKGHRLDRIPAADDFSSPEHLVVMVNGIIGSAGDWRFAAKQLVKKYPEHVIVQRSRCNYNTLTFHGVDVAGERLVKEVLSVVRVLPALRKISFVAHSLGGLIARYAAARLYAENHREDQENGKHKNSDFEQLLDEESRGKIAGLEPMNFITFATPHLGSRWHKQVPLLCGSRALEKLAVRTSGALGRTGRHLFLSDKDADRPLLLQMANDTSDLKFISALKSFQRRVAYANISSDSIVGWQTSSIRRKSECPKREEFMKNERYPHVVHIETPHKVDTSQEIMSNGTADSTDMEEAIIQGLNRVGWERVDVSFRKSNQRIFAHNTILVKTYFLNSDGADVISHMMDNFKL